MRRNAAASCSTAAARTIDWNMSHLVGAEVLDEPEVEERDLAVAVEQVVARVRVAVEGVHAVEAAEHEAEERLAGEVALGAGPTSSTSSNGVPTTSSVVSTRDVDSAGSTSGTWMNGWPR